MGMVTVTLNGSFGDKIVSLSAEEGGHAHALTRAIAFLVRQLPEAIRNDHKLHDDGTRPPKADFGMVPLGDG